jgi:phosphate transport system ATP-binding protein
MPKPDLKLVRPLEAAPAIRLENFQAWFGETCVVNAGALEVPAHKITCLVGPSGSGKSTLLRSLNRINDDISAYAMQGKIFVQGQCNHAGFKDITHLRSKVGMVFQRPCVFPCSIKENVLFGVRDKTLSKIDRAALVEDCLKSAALWKEVSHRLDSPASTLSLGQQQRLCIARTLAVKPDILLLDEPTASVDPVSARALETVIQDLKTRFTIIMVTHDIRQTKRIADHVVFLCDGEIIETGSCGHMFSKIAKPKTRTYLSEEFCDC